ncbi:MAG TPA: NADH-quinone oxidoreductase subunit NuoE [bacterium]|nr:NADH-quinone oxidoreductase subunit NuoE [bacterium]
MSTSALTEIIERYRGKPGSLIPALQKAQAEMGYLSGETLEQVSKGLGIPFSRVFGVATFYSQFYLSPRGKHTIKVCVGTACHVRGAGAALQALEEKLGVKAGNPTEDLNFQLETVACLGTCFLAPAIMIDKDYYGEQTPKTVGKILKKYIGGGADAGTPDPEE